MAKKEMAHVKVMEMFSDGNVKPHLEAEGIPHPIPPNTDIEVSPALLRRLKSSGAVVEPIPAKAVAHLYGPEETVVAEKKGEEGSPSKSGEKELGGDKALDEAKARAEKAEARVAKLEDDLGSKDAKSDSDETVGGGEAEETPEDPKDETVSRGGPPK